MAWHGGRFTVVPTNAAESKPNASRQTFTSRTEGTRVHEGSTESSRCDRIGQNSAYRIERSVKERYHEEASCNMRLHDVLSSSGPVLSPCNLFPLEQDRNYAKKKSKEDKVFVRKPAQARNVRRIVAKQESSETTMASQNAIQASSNYRAIATAISTAYTERHLQRTPMHIPAPPTPSKPKSRAPVFRRGDQLATAFGAVGNKNLIPTSSFSTGGTDNEPQGPSKLRLKLNRVVRRSRRANKLQAFQKSILATVDAFKDQIALTYKSVNAAMATLNAESVEEAPVDSSMCSAASTEDEQVGNRDSVRTKSFGLRISRMPSFLHSRRASRGSAPLFVTHSCMLLATPSARHSVMSITPVSSRRRSRRIRRYLDDSGDEGEEVGKKKAHENEVQTPQERYFPGMGRRKVVCNIQGKALRLYKLPDQTHKTLQNVNGNQSSKHLEQHVVDVPKETPPQPTTEAEKSRLVTFNQFERPSQHVSMVPQAPSHPRESRADQLNAAFCRRFQR